MPLTPIRTCGGYGMNNIYANISSTINMFRDITIYDMSLSAAVPRSRRPASVHSVRGFAFEDEGGPRAASAQYLKNSNAERHPKGVSNARKP